MLTLGLYRLNTQKTRLSAPKTRFSSQNSETIINNNKTAIKTAYEKLKNEVITYFEKSGITLIDVNTIPQDKTAATVNANNSFRLTNFHPLLANIIIHSQSHSDMKKLTEIAQALYPESKTTGLNSNSVHTFWVHPFKATNPMNNKESEHYARLTIVDHMGGPSFPIG